LNQVEQKKRKLVGIGLDEIDSLDLKGKDVELLLSENQNPNFIQKQLRWLNRYIINESYAKDMYSPEDLKEMNLDPDVVILTAYDKENNKLIYLRPYLEFDDGTRGY